MACVQYLVFSSSGSFPPCSSFSSSSHSCFSFFVSHNHYCLFPLLLFSRSVMSDSFQPHGLQHARLLCPSLSPGVCSDSCPLSQWCHPTISSSCPLLLLPSVLPNIKIFSSASTLHIRWPEYWSFSFSISPSNSQCWFPLGLTGLISLQSQGALKSLLQHHSSKAPILQCSAFFMV